MLGPLRLGRIDFLPFPRYVWGYGLLGLNVLSRYRIQVVPGKRLALRPRGDTWESAPQRIARWPWTRACSSLGCLRARALEPAGNDARLVFSFEVDLPYPVALLLGCRKADPAGSHLPTISERVTSGRNGDRMYIILSVASAAKDQTLETMVSAGSRWLSRTRCREVSVLDVMPISLEQIPGGAVHAALWP
jgi:hypothetical protein